MPEPPGIAVTETPQDSPDPRIRLFQHSTVVTTAAVVTERYVVLLDTGLTPLYMAVVMELLADVLPGRQVLVVNTHADWDHYWGNALFVGPDAPYPALVLGHSLMPGRIAAEGDATLARLHAELAADYPAEMAAVRLIPPSVTFTPPLTIDGGDLTLDLIATPGHQPDHVAVWIPELRLVWAADAAERPWPHANNPATLPVLRASLAAMAALQPNWVLACHAPGVTDPALLDQNIAYFDTLETHGRAALAAGMVGPADVAAGVDPAALPERIGFPATTALAPGLDPAILEGYLGPHARNVQVMLAWLIGAEQAAPPTS